MVSSSAVPPLPLPLPGPPLTVKLEPPSLLPVTVRFVFAPTAEFPTMFITTFLPTGQEAAQLTVPTLPLKLTEEIAQFGNRTYEFRSATPVTSIPVTPPASRMPDWPSL